jgi:hypothetical protein
MRARQVEMLFVWVGLVGWGKVLSNQPTKPNLSSINHICCSLCMILTCARSVRGIPCSSSVVERHLGLIVFVIHSSVLFHESVFKNVFISLGRH